MDPNLIPNTLAIALFLVAVFVSLQSFNLYTRVHNPRLFILGLSMGVISLTAADNLVANFITIPFNTYWFLYFGQTISFFFIWSSFFWSSDEYLRRLMNWHIFASILTVIGLLLLSPLFPPFPNNVIRAIASGSRSIPCFGIFYCYMFAFMRKETRFSFLMGLAFLLLAFGPWFVIEKYFVSNPDLYDYTGDITRLIGLSILLTAVLGG
jgi:hypothetical protein